MGNIDELATLRQKPFINKIQHFRNLVVNRQKLVFLIGAGCSKCASLPLISELTHQVMSHPSLNCRAQDRDILDAVKHIYKRSGNAHIEHYISEMADWIAIATRRKQLSAAALTIDVAGQSFCLTDLHDTTNRIKETIACILHQKVPLDIHRQFVQSIHSPLRTGRPPSPMPVDYLVLNYDTLIEDALALEQVLYTDGIEGGASGWWREEKLQQTGWRARVIKLHGSIDWRVLPHDTHPRRIGPGVRLPKEYDLPILIWPSSTKYRESQLDPFAQLIERARHALSSDRNSQCLLVICGYSFGDDHINLEIDRALRKTDAELTVVAFSNLSKPMGQLKKWREDNDIKDRVLIYGRNGFFHGDSECNSQYDLNWWKFEIMTKILKGDI